MKKIYIKPYAETVNVRLFSSVLGGDPQPGGWSEGTETVDAKEQGDFFEMDDDSFGDIWGTDEDSKGLWE